MPTDFYDFLGRAVAVRSNSPAVLEHLRGVYGRFLRDPAPQEGAGAEGESSVAVHAIEFDDAIERNGELRLRSTFGSLVLYCLGLREFDRGRYPGTSEGDPLSVVQWMLLRDLGLLAPEYLLLHAGAVSRDGTAVIFPADGGGGKTSLTVRLVLEGFGFLSDEVACLHPERGIVEPFPRRLNLAESARRRLGLPRPPEFAARGRNDGELEWSIPIEAIARDAISGAARLGYVLLPHGFDRTTHLEPLSKTAAAVEMLRRSHSPVPDVTDALLRLAPALKDVPCYRMIVGVLDEAARVIGDLVKRGTGG